MRGDLVADALLRANKRHDGGEVLVAEALILHQRDRGVAIGAHAEPHDSRQLPVRAAPDTSVGVGRDIGREDLPEGQREHVGAGQGQDRAAVERLPLLPDHVTVRASRRPVNEVPAALDDFRSGRGDNRRIRRRKRAGPAKLHGDESADDQQHQGRDDAPEGGSDWEWHDGYWIAVYSR
jgi:hypothetical protein